MYESRAEMSGYCKTFFDECIQLSKGIGKNTALLASKVYALILTFSNQRKVKIFFLAISEMIAILPFRITSYSELEEAMTHSENWKFF